MSEPVPPDHIYPPGSDVPVPTRAMLKEAILALPNLLKLLARLMRDPRVPRRSKILVGATLAYLASPIDLLPDALPVLGQTDDVLLVAFALSHLIRTAGEEVVVGHWDGAQDILQLIRGIVDFGAGLVPRRLRALLGRLGG